MGWRANNLDFTEVDSQANLPGHQIVGARLTHNWQYGWFGLRLPVGSWLAYLRAVRLSANPPTHPTVDHQPPNSTKSKFALLAQRYTPFNESIPLGRGMR